jgi:GTP-binding protein
VFVDKAEIFVRGGRGGDGIVAFLHEKFMPHGGPAGGDGGRGGSVIIRATERVATLLDIARQPHIRAESGKAGGKKNMAGKSGKDLLVQIPRGTLVRDRASGAVVRDMTAEGEDFVIAKGGRGGKGNARFKSSTNQTPRECTQGEPGQEGWYVLELKLIADVGLVGLPNAGKSTLLGRISAARPKVADYPFTTLHPVPGIVSLGEYRSCVVADIPGLIEGAHLGHGLGHEFLRHVERTRMLVHLVDMAPLSGPAPVDAYRQIRAELAAYSPALAEKPEIICANKLDLSDAAAGLEAFKAALGADREVVAISAVTGEGIPRLLGAISRALDTLPKAVI